jgi:multidrug efflux pump subunit AcrA (membrane-fusion protein)
VPNANGAIRGGTAATGRIVLRTVPDALVVPSAAIRQDASGASLAYRIQNQELEPLPVGTGVVDAGRALTQVATGLREGDMVVVGNVGTLGRGMKVTIIGADNRAPGTAPTSGR